MPFLDSPGWMWKICSKSYFIHIGFDYRNGSQDALSSALLKSVLQCIPQRRPTFILAAPSGLFTFFRLANFSRCSIVLTQGQKIYLILTSVLSVENFLCRRFSS